jgi:Tfp pilus assembly protein PilF
MRLLPVATLVSALAAALLGAGCAMTPPPPVGLLDVTSRPAERALQGGIRAYEDGQYPEAEKQLNLALTTGLVSPRDRAAAHKHLAFIYCTSSRASDCEAAFRAARQADPAFALNKSEQGHPVWGPVYKRVQP